MSVGGVVSIKGKGEVVGNLVSARMGPRGVAKFSFGEYFEASPLFETVEPTRLTVESHTWGMGPVKRWVKADGSRLEEMLATYGDALTYSLSNTSGRAVGLHLKGSMSVFSWFNPEVRHKIAKLAGIVFEPRKGLGFTASYKDAYSLYVALPGMSRFKAGEGVVSYGVKAELKAGGTFTVALAGSPSPEEAMSMAEEALTDPEGLALRRAEEVKGFLARAPRPAGLKPRRALLWDYMWYVILSNRATVRNHPVLKSAFNMPSKHVFRHQWLWDSAFHAVVLSGYDVVMAEEELRNLFRAQKPDGRIPHEIFLSREFCSLFWGVDDYSPWTTQPPVVAVAVDRIRRAGGSRAFLEEAFEALDRYDAWFRRSRDADKDQLMAYVDYLESGWDNGVRWDLAIKKFKDDPGRYEGLYRRVRMAPVEAVDLNCFIYLQRSTLSSLASELGHGDEAEEYARLAEDTAAGIRRLMWDPDTGFYYDVYEEDHGRVRVKTPAAFLTLFAGLADRGQARALVGHLVNRNEFWTAFPLPSVSADDPEYDPRGYWRGRSWLNLVWFTYWGLRRYGFEDGAKALAETVLDVMARGPTCNENYDSSSGEPLGAPDFGWSTLALDMLAELSGSPLDRSHFSHRRTLNPYVNPTGRHRPMWLSGPRFIRR